MSTLPLYTRPTHLDGWHRVIAPGGYESWHFEADSNEGCTRVIAGLHLGSQSNRRYMRRYAWYRAMPTRVAPPVPGDWPTVTIELQHDGQTIARMANHLAGAEFSAATDSLRVRIGSNHVAGSADRSVHLSVRAVETSRTVAADLVFRPVVRASHQWEFKPRHWVMLVDPVCEVDGEVQLFDTTREATPPRVIAIAGPGYREHRVGLRSVHEDGVMLMARKVEERRVAVGCQVDQSTRVIELDATGARERASDPEEFRSAGWRVEKSWRRGWLEALGL